MFLNNKTFEKLLNILFCIFIEHNFYIFVKTHNEIFTCKDIPELLTLKYPIQSIISQSLLSDKPEYIGARGARERSDKKIIFPDPAINSRTNLRQRSFANNISSRKISLPDQPWLSHFPSAHLPSLSPVVFAAEMFAVMYSLPEIRVQLFIKLLQHRLHCI